LYVLIRISFKVKPELANLLTFLKRSENPKASYSWKSQKVREKDLLTQLSVVIFSED